MAQEDKRMQGKMNVMQAKIAARNRALKQKEQDNLRLVLLKKREEALEYQRKEKVHELMVDRLIRKEDKEAEQDKEREQYIKRNRIDKAITKIEHDIAKEN